MTGWPLPGPRPPSSPGRATTPGLPGTHAHKNLELYSGSRSWEWSEDEETLSGYEPSQAGTESDSDTSFTLSMLYRESAHADSPRSLHRDSDRRD